MNYESEFQSVLVESLKRLYGITEESILYAYFQLRYRIWKCNQPDDAYIAETRKQIKFLQRELNLSTEEGRIQYKKEWILMGFSLENSLQNIIESWNFEHSLKTVVNDKGVSLPMEEYVESEWKKIKRRASNKAKPFKSTPTYPHYLQKHALDTINRVFQVTPLTPSKIPHIYYPVTHNVFVRSMEEEVDVYIHSEEMSRTDTKTIEEKDVEQFLRHRLEKVEEGLKYVSHQYYIPDARIDIVAKDKNNTYVILELKVVDDKELIWQSMYYPSALQKKLKVSKVRMITLSPSYSPSLLLPLKQLSHVEIMTFTPYVECGVIKDIVIKRIN
jgi:hypothetical protein